MNTKNKSKKKNYISAKLSRGKKILITASSLLLLTIIIIGGSSIFNAAAAGTIGGRVFQDFNGNGTYDTAGSAALPAIDAGVGGITVTVYDSNGAVQGTATTSAVTAALGQYSINATGTGPYRVEFTNLPANFKPSARSNNSVTGRTATNSGSTVQFVPDGSTANVNLAVNVPEDYCQNNPEIASCNYSVGNQTALPSSIATALLSFPYTAGSTDTSTAAPTVNFDNPDYTLPTNSFLNVTATNVGTTFGLAYARSTRLLYASAFFKRHSGFGTGVDNTINTADDPGAVYVLNRTGNGNKGAVASKFTVPNATTNSHATAAYQTDNGNTGWNAVGKTSLGGMAISDDDGELYVMNLENRTLYRRDLATSTFTSQAVPTANLPTANGTCAAADVRPFAVTYYRDEVYVGMVCSGESSATVDTFTDVAGGTAGVYDSNEYYLDSNNNGVYNAGEPYYDANGSGTYNAGDTFVDNDGNGIYNLGDARKLTAYVYRVNPTTLAFGATPTFTAPLNYKRGLNQQSLGAVGIWRPWSTIYRNVNSTANRTVYSQPMLTGITFDRGNLVMGLRDRAGDQIGHQTNSNPNDAGTLYQPRTGGDTLRACGNPANGWTLEANGRCGGTGNAPQNTDQGPENAARAGGEFYYGDSYDLAFAFNQPAGQPDLPGKGGNHDELSMGGVAQMPGASDVMATIFDPIPNVPNETHDGGVRWLNNTTGNFAKAYRIYDGDTGTVGTLGKANGIGDLELLCDSAPIEIGNRVWIDTDGDGVQDPQTATETGRQNITVELYTGDLNNDGDILDANENVFVGTTTTDVNGEWYFNNANVADGDPTTTGNQPGLKTNTNYIARIGTADFTGGAGVGDLAGLLVTRSNIATLLGTETVAVNNTDSRDSDATVTGGRAEIRFNSSTAGSNNHTLDFGFTTPVSIGSTVFNDANNNGLFDAGESGIGGVPVQLLYDANNDGVINGTELTTPIAAINTSLVAGSVGNYYFNGLTPGIYQVLIPTPPAAAPLSSAPGVTDTTDNQQDNDDNGTQTGGTGSLTISPLITLLPDTEPLNAVETGQGGTQDDADDDNGDMTVDFGFLAPASVGNFVFVDTNRNGIQDGGEVGLNGVTVTLYDSVGTAIATTATAGGGFYSFTGLFPGTYSVGFTRPFGYGFSPQDATGDTLDSDANILTGRTANFTLAAGQNNVDIDAGVFLSVSVGNRVWNDANNNGIFNAGEAAISGATVNLYLDANDDGVADGAAIRTTTTDAGGLYLFDGLAPNTYIVAVVTPANFVRSSVNGGDPDNNVDNDNNGVLAVGTETRSNPVTLTLGAEPTGETPNNDTNTADNSSNLTVDFGFTASYSIGNRVWFDTNNNGQINAGEVGINNVSVSLFASSNLTTALQTITTDSSGYYRFDGVVPGSYVVRIDPSNFAPGGALAGYQNTTGNTAANTDSTATLGGEDGINPTGAANTVLTSGILSNVKTITLGTFVEPTGEGDVQASGQGTNDNQANMTIDFGFYKLNLSGTVWLDTGAGANNNNGILDAGEAVMPNAVVFLYDSTGTEIPVGYDGILGTADDTVGGMQTDSSGNYNFQGLPPGTYRVGINTARTGTSSTFTAADTNLNTDNDDDGGVNPSFPQRVVSGLITLTPGGEPSITQATGTTLNTTVDFGFIIAPTLVTLDSFDVLSDGESATIKWATASEDANLGFNIYREVNGKRERLNSSPIIGTALRSRINLEAKSAGYSWTDVEPVENAVYYLEDIDMKGRRTVHGPVTPLMQDSGLGRISNSKLLSDLRKLTKTAKQTDSIETGNTAAKANTYGNNRQQFEIAARDGVKIAVQRDGWYRISIGDLQNAGFNTNSDPTDWQLFADGEEVPFRFGADNAVEFYGHGLDLLETDKQIYYLTVGKSAGRRLPEEQSAEVENRNDAASFRNTAAIKDRTIYLIGVLNGDEGNWFGALVYQGESAEYDLAVNNRFENGQAHLKVKLQGLSDLGHAVNLRFNDLDLGALNFDAYNNQAFEFDVPMSAVIEGNNRITLSGIGDDDDLVSVDEVSLTYERRFTARDNKLAFRVPAGNTVEVGGFSDAGINVVEVNNNRAVRRLAVQPAQTENGFAFGLNAAGYDREFVAFTDSQTNAPASIVRNTASRWNSAKNKGQFVIIAPERFREAATNLANVRRQEGLQTQVVPVEDIYDEFSFGKTSVSAVKEFLQTASQTWEVTPKFVLLFGDASYDMRNYLAQPDRNLVPTKLIDTQMFETSSDAWIADFDDDGIEDISIGRLPAGTEAEAAKLVEKITRPTETNDLRDQKTNLFVADSGFDVNADELRGTLPGNVNSSVIRRSQMDTAQTRGEIISQTNSGQSVITYVGHGSSIAWSSSGFFRTTDATGLKNDKLSFYLLMTCLNGYAIDPGSDSLAESLIKADNGAFGVWVSSGATHVGGQAEISRAATDLIFNRPNKPLRIGDIARIAKLATQDAEIRKTWQLIGDPTMFVK